MTNRIITYLLLSLSLLTFAAEAFASELHGVTCEIYSKQTADVDNDGYIGKVEFYRIRSLVSDDSASKFDLNSYTAIYDFYKAPNDFIIKRKSRYDDFQITLGELKSLIDQPIIVHFVKLKKDEDFYTFTVDTEEGTRQAKANGNFNIFRKSAKTQTTLFEYPYLNETNIYNCQRLEEKNALKNYASYMNVLGDKFKYTSYTFDIFFDAFEESQRAKNKL